MKQRAAAVLLMLAAAAASAQTPTPTPMQATDAGEIAPRLSPLLGLLLGRVVDAALEGATGENTAGLFRRLARQMKAGGAESPADTAPLRLNVAVAAGSAAEPSLMPALAYAMEQLDPASFAVMRPVPVGGSGPLLRTGDVFVLQFSTNLPGQVRLENVDPGGRVADLGTYNVLVDQLNRLPRDKGIQLQGQPGLETLRFLFYPCLPPEAAGKPWAGDFAGKLPPCSATVNSSVQVASAGRLYGQVTPRALVNLAQPDPNMVFAGASDYQPGELTAMEARIRHEARLPR